MNLSSALAAFLGKKRSIAIAPPPPIEASNDRYLEEFSSSAKKSLERVKGLDEGSDGDEQSDRDSEEDPSERLVSAGSRRESMASVTKNVGDSDEDGELDEDGEEKGDEAHLKALEEEASILCVRLFNLPYKLVGESALVKFCEDLEIVCEEARFDYKEGQFAGSARLWIRIPKAGVVAAEPDGEKAEALREGERSSVMKRLQGQDCGGRPVKAVRSGKDRGGNTFTPHTVSAYENADRYYERLESISVKCNACGQVGHIEKECDFPRKPLPCHLCGGDHEGYECTSLVCYRCQEVGHHSKECNIPYKRLLHLRLKQPLHLATHEATVFQSICSHCGERGHNKRFCPQVLLSASSSGDRDRDRRKSAGAEAFTALDGHPEAICMVCSKRGHVMCNPLPSASAAIAKGLDFGWARGIDPRNPPTISRVEQGGTEHKNTRSASASPSSSEASTAAFIARNDHIDVYCPYCARKGHHAGFSQAQGSGNTPQQKHKHRGVGVCQGDLARRIESEAERLRANRRFLGRGGSGGGDNFGKYSKNRDNGARDVPPAPLLTVPGQNSKKVGRFSAQAAALAGSHRTIDSSGQGRKRARGDAGGGLGDSSDYEDVDEEDDDDDDNDDNDDDDDYMSARFISGAGEKKRKKKRKRDQKEKSRGRDRKEEKKEKKEKKRRGN